MSGELTDLIFASMDALRSIAATNEISQAAAKAAMPEPRWRDQFVYNTIKFPRQCGHTEAAIRIGQKYSNTLIIPHSYGAHQLLKDRSKDTVYGMSLGEATEKGGGRNVPHELRTVSKLAGGLDYLIFDGGGPTPEQLADVMLNFSPKIVVFLGDCSVPHVYTPPRKTTGD